VSLYNSDCSDFVVFKVLDNTALAVLFAKLIFIFRA